LQAHAAIVEAVAETLRSNADDHDGSDRNKTNKFALLVAQIKDAAAGVEQLRAVNVSHDIPPLSPLLFALLLLVYESCLALSVTYLVVHVQSERLGAAAAIWNSTSLHTSRN